VTLLALHRGVSAKKREAVLVILYLLNGNIPPTHGVALGAIGAEFSPVNISMTISTVFSGVRENRLHVALRALHFLVHASQRVVRVVMIELRMCPNGPPAACGMAVFAGNRERPVWASRSLFLCRGRCEQPNCAQN
jgi:hypothetical protein